MPPGRVALKLEPDAKRHRAPVTIVAVRQQWVPIDTVSLRLVEQILSFERDAELVVDFIRNVCGHPGKRVGKLVIAITQNPDRGHETVGMVRSGANRPWPLLVHQARRVHRWRDAFERPLLAIHPALRPVAGVLHPEPEATLPEVLQADFEAMHLCI